MDHQPRPLGLLLSILTCAILTGPASAADPAPGISDYDRWVSSHTSENSLSRQFDAKNPLKLRITAVEGDNVAPDDPNIHFDSKLSDHGTTITADGNVSSFSHDSWSIKGGGGGPPLPNETLTRLDELLAKLPDDGKRLPPPDRKLLVEADLNGARTVRVYDRANAPATVWEILRLSKCSIGSLVLDFKAADSVIDARGNESGGVLRLAPGGKQLIFTGYHQPLQFWDFITHELLREVRCPRGSSATAIDFSPDGTKVVVINDYELLVVDPKTWAFRKTQLRSSSMRFTPDGLHLLLSSPNRDLRVVDASTWELTDPLPEIPPDAVQYLPALGNKHAVAQLKSGAVVLWDVAGRRIIATLRDSGRLLDAVFSPDESRVVVQTDVPPKARSEANFKIWNTATGELVHELQPFERSGRERSVGLLWTPDGQYVLAGVTVYLNSSHAVCVFNAATGKHLAMFSGFFSINGVVLPRDSSQLAIGCEDGKIRLWDFKTAMKSVREFEASLPPLATP